jgi:hypothetical protein
MRVTAGGNFLIHREDLRKPDLSELFTAGAATKAANLSRRSTRPTAPLVMQMCQQRS